MATVLLWAGFFLGYETWEYREYIEPMAFLTRGLIKVHPLLAAGLAMIMVLVQALWLNYLAQRSGLLSKTSYLAAFFFLLISGAPEGNLMPAAVILANVFVLAALHALINAYDHENTIKSVFHASLFIGIGSLFYFPVLGLWVFILVALIIYRELTYREIIFALLGLLPAAGGVILYFFYTGEIIQYLNTVQQQFLSWAIVVELTLPELAAGGMIFLAMLSSVFFMLSHINERTIMIRRFISLLIWFLVFVLLLTGYAEDPLQQTIMLSVPLAVFLASIGESIKKKFIVEWGVWIYILVLTIYRLQHLIRDGFNFDFPVYKFFV
ncbi:MAG: DUF6427 family protein [Bacteroidales bacterium]